MTISGLISSMSMSFSTKALYRIGNSDLPSSAASPVSSSAALMAATFSAVTPASGLMAMVWIFSGVAWATSSMSMPPSVETTKAV